VIIKVLQQALEEIKDCADCDLKQLVIACLTLIIKFFVALKDTLKKVILKHKSNFTPDQIGHLVPLTVGHRDRPTEKEMHYIRLVMKQSNFFPQEDDNELPQKLIPASDSESIDINHLL